MSEQPHVLSSEEVDAILKASQEKKVVLSGDEAESHINVALTNIGELVRMECEDILVSFLRKKLIIEPKQFETIKLSQYLKDKDQINSYSAFRINWKKTCYGLMIIDMPFLHQAINLLFGGQINPEEPIITNPGKIGFLVAEKICNIILSGFASACEEYAEFTAETIKTSTYPNMTTHINMDEDFYLLNAPIAFDKIETALKIAIPVSFLNELITTHYGKTKHIDKDFWRSAIKSQVVDTYVTISVTLPDVAMKMQEFMGLQEGDMIPIGDPTVAYVCLNNLKLFRALAAQSNSKRVAKIVNQI